MRRLVIATQVLLGILLVGASSSPAMRRAGGKRAPSLVVSAGTLHWTSLPGVRSYVVAAAVDGRVKLHIVERARFRPSPRPGHTVAYTVRARVRHAPWSRTVNIRWPAIGRASQDPQRLMVSVQNTTGWGVDAIFRDAGVRYERLDVGDGSNLTLVTKALGNGMTPLVLYNPGDGGSLENVSPAEAASQVVSLAQRLTWLAARYPSLAKLGAIEFGNEVYVGESATQYAAQYDAVHRALAAHRLGAWKLLAVATAVCGSMHAANWIPDLIHHMSAGSGEVDGWTVHPYGSVTSDASRDCPGPHGYGWPNVRDWHHIATSHGSDAPWYVTEVGQCISAGTDCPNVVDPGTQAADMTSYLTEASRYRWLAFFNWYTSCDDGSGGYGLLAKNDAGVCGVNGASDRRPAFEAMARWIAANGEG